MSKSPKPPQSPSITTNGGAPIADAMEGAPSEIKLRQLVHFHPADPAYAKGAPGFGSLSTE
ncbi:MAG: hypothetical protein ACFCUQ_13060 [Kiloniellales bacterium]